jgi:hypothetical protein
VSDPAFDLLQAHTCEHCDGTGGERGERLHRFETRMNRFYDWSQRDTGYPTRTLRAFLLVSVSTVLRPYGWWLGLPLGRIWENDQYVLRDLFTYGLPLQIAQVFWYGSLHKHSKFMAAYPCQVCRAKIAVRLVQLLREGACEENPFGEAYTVRFGDGAALQTAIEEYQKIDADGKGHATCRGIGDVLGERWAGVP